MTLMAGILLVVILVLAVIFVYAMCAAASRWEPLDIHEREKKDGQG